MILTWQKSTMRAVGEIREALAPRSLALADSFNNLGLVASNRGRLEMAEALHFRALEIRQEKVPNSLFEATSWVNLGSVKLKRGDKDRAEEYLLHAKSQIEKISPNHSLLREAYMSLGLVAWENSQLDKAELYLSLALDMAGDISKTSVNYARGLHNFGLLDFTRGDIRKAQTQFLKALELYEARAPGSIWHADLLNNLGSIAIEDGAWGQAKEYFERALEINQKLAPDSLSLADALTNLGSLSEMVGQRNQAKDFYLEALELYRQLAPEGFMHGNALVNMAIVTARSGDLAHALELSEQAYLLIRTLSTREQAGNHFLLLETGYRTYIVLLVKAGREREAFYISEEFRALAMLRQMGHLEILQTLFPESQEILKEIGHRGDALQHEIWGTKDPQEKSRLNRELLELRVQAEEMKQEIFRQSPYFVEYGHPLSVEKVLDGLEPGSLVLSYFVQYGGVVAFGLSREEGLIVRSLPETNAELEEKIQLLQAVEAEPKNSRIRKVHQDLGEQLFHKLLGPFREQVEKAERIIIIPDGPLWHLPFAALGEKQEQGFRYLIEWKPITTIASATLYDYLKKKKPRKEIRIAAFGAPVYPDPQGGEISNTDMQDPANPINSLRPLPGTKQEVASIASLFPNTDTFLGADATEANFKTLGAKYAWIHVESHAVYEKDPSHGRTGVYFSVLKPYQPGAENGILQYGEIFGLDLQADLLVLSACQTALGRNAGGQGMAGMTRAFQYAGVRTILASLWEVDDEATAQLMGHFYRFLKEGNQPAFALRFAQIEMIHATPEDGFWATLKRRLGFREKEFSSHLHWAPFQSIGPF